MTPLEQWPETVEMLCKYWPEKFTTTRWWSGHEYEEVLHLSGCGLLFPTKLDSLAAASTAIDVVTETVYTFGVLPYIAIFWHLNGDRSNCGAYSTEPIARLAAVNAAARYMVKVKGGE